ncbi:LPS assembly protein LptD [Candidatus Photodesmus anomalopis]|nr:LPS assembly protein LptD [Candidatus Photodesmus katoptron]
MNLRTYILFMTLVLQNIFVLNWIKKIEKTDIKFLLTLLRNLINVVFFTLISTQILAKSDKSLQDECCSNKQCVNAKLPLIDSNTSSIQIEANSLEAFNQNKVKYSGNVVIVQGNKQIKSDTVTLYEINKRIVAQGNVNINDGKLDIFSDKVVNYFDTDFMLMENNKYNFLCKPGRGEAYKISKIDKSTYIMENAYITSCSEKNNTWKLNASRIVIDQNKEEATFYHPRFKIYNFPIFYLPILTVPISNTRKTGFLYPNISYGSKNGFTIETPIYWNLSENYDLETTLIHMTKRNLQFNNKFRYLSTFGSGTIHLEFLPKDKKHPEKKKRWGLLYKHEGNFQQDWKLKFNYLKISDNNYFSNVNSNIGNQENNQIQESKISYYSDKWDISLLIHNLQPFTENDIPYRIIPQFNFNYYAPMLMKFLDFDLTGQISKFNANNKKAPSTIRIHIEPGLKVPISNSWGVWITEARLLGTYYQEKTAPSAHLKRQKKQITRLIPTFKTRGSIILERHMKTFKNYIQTLEPEIQYLYIPEKEKSNSSYDTTFLQTDYYHLFRNRNFSSIDKIVGSNQFSYAVSSRFFNNSYKERLNISLGQIFYLKKNFTNIQSNISSSHYSSLSATMDFNYDDNLFYHSNFQYDTNSKKIQLSNFTLEYQFNNGYLQTSYRYIKPSYIEKILAYGYSKDRLKELSQSKISQLGLLTAYQINHKWQANAQYFFDLTTKQELEWLTGLGYHSNCWYVALTYSKELKNQKTKNNKKPKYEDRFNLKFGVLGFGTNSNLKLNNRIIGNEFTSRLGYSHPFLLKQSTT